MTDEQLYAAELRAEKRIRAALATPAAAEIAQPAAPEPLTYAQFEAETNALPDDAFDGIEEPPNEGGDHRAKQIAFMGWLTAKLSATQASAPQVEPTRETLASLLAALHYGQYADNDEYARLKRNIERALKDYDIGAGKFVLSAAPRPWSAPRAD